MSEWLDVVDQNALADGENIVVDVRWNGCGRV